MITGQQKEELRRTDKDTIRDKIKNLIA